MYPHLLSRGHGTNMSLSLNAWKGLSMAVFTVLSVIGAWIAIVLKERAKQIYVTCGVVFSAGVLLAGGFVHLLVDSNEQFEDMGIKSFQWAFAITGITVAGLHCLEISIERAVENRAIAHTKGSRNKPKRQSTTGNVDSSSDEEAAKGDKHSADDPENDGNSDAAHDHHTHHDHGQVMDADHPFSSLLLTIALSIHSIIEGLGIGATDNISSLESSFVAVAFHKGFTAFALANGLISSGFWSDKSKRKWFYLSVGIFISVALLGIGIGWAISTAESSLATAILTGVTGGSFIYVAALEILPEESSTIKRARLPILPVAFFFLAGYCLMALLAIWA